VGSGISLGRRQRHVSVLAGGVLMVAVVTATGDAFPLTQRTAPTAATPTLPAGTVVYSHEETGSTDHTLQYFNLYRLDPQNPAAVSRITNYSWPTTTEWPVWSKDFSRLAFVSNVNDGLRSLESKSVYIIDPHGGNLRQVTGFGLINPLPLSTGSIQGHVVPPPTDGTPTVSSCFVSVQGDVRAAVSCAGGTFTITGVPTGATWVRAQATVLDALNGPGSTMGFDLPVQLAAGQANQVPDIELSQNIPQSNEPAWSTDDRHFVITQFIDGASIQPSPITGQLTWTRYETSQLQVWSSDGTTTQAIPSAPGFEYAGADWSPVDSRICLASIATAGGLSSLDLVDPNGSNLLPIYTVPSPLTGVLSTIVSCRWSPDGQRLAFIQASGSFGLYWSDLYLVNRDGTNLIRLTNNEPPIGSLSNGLFVSAPTWSPDQTGLAFEVDVIPGTPPSPPTSSDLVAVNLTTGAAVRLTFDGRSTEPSWGPSSPPAITVVPPALPAAPGVAAARPASPGLPATAIGTLGRLVPPPILPGPAGPRSLPSSVSRARASPSASVGDPRASANPASSVQLALAALREMASLLSGP
jgi:Tol biopolymer transport system component